MVECLPGVRGARLPSLTSLKWGVLTYAFHPSTCEEEVQSQLVYIESSRLTRATYGNPVSKKKEKRVEVAE